MTYREKYLEEHSGDPNLTNFVIDECPENCVSPSYCPMVVDVDDVGDFNERCRLCWDREIPEEDEVSMKEACEKIWDFTVEVVEKKNHIMKPGEIYDELVKAAYGGPSTKELSESLDLRETPHIKDSGNRREFESGAVRDIQEGKGRCDLLPLDVVSEYIRLRKNDRDWKIIQCICDFTETNDLDRLYCAIDVFTCHYKYADDEDYTMLLEVAKHFEEGCKKYGENNWRKGIPTHCYIDSAVRHYLKFLRGDRDEPHDRAFVWNIMCCIWTCRHKPELNDYCKEGECDGKTKDGE